MDNKYNLQIGGGKQRESNVELFRILATFLVLVVHFTGWFVGGLGDPFDTSKDLSFRIGQMILEALSCVCVNCFLIISGWFGIKLKFKSIWKMYTLLFFIYIPFQLVTTIYIGNFSFMQLADNILVFTRESYFVQCYMMLMFLSPLINSFFEKYGKKSLYLVFALWVIEAFMGNVRGNVSLGINEGYSVIHFVIMYMLARTAALYKDELLKVKRYKWIIGYFLCAGLICIIHLTGYVHTWAYSNPIIVIESFCLFFPFLYGTFYNKRINWLAGSAFAVYIIHTTAPMYNVLVLLDNWMLEHWSYWLYLPGYLFVCVIVFFLSIFYDKVREYSTKSLTDKLYNYLNLRIKRYFVYE